MIRMKKRLTMFSALALSFTILAGCGTNNAANNTASPSASAPAADPVEIQFYLTGSQNVKDLWDTLVPMFEEKNPNTKVNVVYVASGGDSEQIYNKVIAAKKAGSGSGGVDLYEDSLAKVVQGQKDDVWETLSTDGIPNLSNVDSKNLNDVSNLAIPYRSSAVLLAYNSEKVPTPPKTMDELITWIKNNPERFAYNDPSTGGSGNSFVSTVLYKDLPEDAIHSSDPAIMSQWDAGFKTLKEIGKYVYGKGIYPKKNQGTLDLLASGEVDMIPAWSDMVLQQVGAGTLPATTKLAQLTPGFNGGPTYLMVNKLSDKKEAVNAFLNFVLSPEAQEVIVNKLNGFPGIKLDNMSQEMQDKFAEVSKGFRTFNLGDLGGEINKRWQSEVAAQ
jgi:putative spermidine/putrescine transport system substrate-binding protein